MEVTFRRIVMLSVLPLFGCGVATVNYTSLVGPRYAGGAPVAALTDDTLDIVTFNVKYAKRVDSAIRVLRETSALRRMDVLLLQEMDAPGTKAVAESLGFHYVYYPATKHPITRRDFGNAILSRYPLEHDRKVLLPHLSRTRKTPRIAVGATITVGTQRVRVYSVHLATMIENAPGERRAQLAAVFADADSADQVIIGGDFNSRSIASIAPARGYAWPTQRIGRTMSLWSLDHVLLKGIAPVGEAGMGTVRELFGASDHRPVWIRVVLSPMAVSGVSNGENPSEERQAM